MSRILFLTTAHHYNDDRIFHHQAKALLAAGHTVKIVSLSSSYTGFLEGVEIESKDILSECTENKQAFFCEIIEAFKPQCCICSEPLAVVSASTAHHQVKIIYDVTEWYPSRRMVSPYKGLSKIFHTVKFFLINVYAGFLSTSFIFGETTKMFPLASLFPWKNHLLLPYYPDEQYITYTQETRKNKHLNLFYSGQFSEDKGVGSFLNAVAALKRSRPDISLSVLLLGSARKKEDEIYFTELLQKYPWPELTVQPGVAFEDFSKTYAHADLCFDLRAASFENHRCLPIKIFYYMAGGKPVIYSDLMAINQHMDVSPFGHLVQPDKPEEIAAIIASYADSPDLLHQHSLNARKLYTQYYHWGSVKDRFVEFIHQNI